MTAMTLTKTNKTSRSVMLSDGDDHNVDQSKCDGEAHHDDE